MHPKALGRLKKDRPVPWDFWPDTQLGVRRFCRWAIRYFGRSVNFSNDRNVDGLALKDDTLSGSARLGKKICELLCPFGFGQPKRELEAADGFCVSGILNPMRKR